MTSANPSRNTALEEAPPRPSLGAAGSVDGLRLDADLCGPSPHPPRGEAKAAPLDLLAYVHLRNIYRSTGAGRVARQLVEHLARRSDINLHVLCDSKDRERILPKVKEPWTSFTYHEFKLETSRQQALWYAIDRPRAEFYWREAKVLFCTAESYVPTLAARLAVTVHDAAYFEKGAHSKTSAVWQQRMKWKLLFKRLEARVDLFHTVSQFSAERLSHYFPSIAPRIRIVPNAVTPHFFEAVTGAGIDYLHQSGLAGRMFVLVPGGLHFRKNADLILDSSPMLLERFPELLIAVVNHSDPSYAARAAEAGPRFRLLGFVEEDALRALYGAAAIVWFPSRYEGFGMPVIEAMACGAPVVASNAAALPEVSGDAAVLVDPEDPGDHVAAIEALLEDDAARMELSRRGVARAARFTWTSSAAQLKRHFDELL